MLRRRKPHKQIELGTTGRFGWRKVRVSDAERRTHTYVIGITGKGKSKLLEHILFQDIIHGRGCGVLDPHSDLIDDLLRYLASNPQQAEPHWQRVVYFDPSRTDFVIPFNVLNTPYSAYETAQNVVEAFRRTWPQALAEAPRFANIVTAAVLTLVPNKLTLVEMPRLLTDAVFRGRLLQHVEDEEVIAFWRSRYEKWGRDQPKMIESVLNKVTAFTFNPQLRQILGTSDNRLDFRQIMDEGKVLLVDLGRCDVETRRLLGSLIVTGLEQAARARRGHAERKPFYFCIDEFQDFCSNDGSAQTLAQILSECRKFGLHLTLAHQTLAQINERMKGALGNIQLKIVFGVSRPDAEIMARHLFRVDGERVKHVVNDGEQQARSHPVFYSLFEEWEKAVQALQALPARSAHMTRPQLRMTTGQLQTATVRYRKRGTPIALLQRELARQGGVSAEKIEKVKMGEPGVKNRPKIRVKRSV